MVCSLESLVGGNHYSRVARRINHFIYTLAAAAALTLIIPSCGGNPTYPTKVPSVYQSSVEEPAPNPTEEPKPEPTSQTVTFFIAGDFAYPTSIEGAEATAKLPDRDKSAIIGGAGDYAYPSGTKEEFMTLFEPTWGRHRYRFFPAKGNHEKNPYYYEYFDHVKRITDASFNLGPMGLDYYAYDFGNWRMIVLDSNSPDSMQLNWLRQELNSRPNQICTLAYFHHPPISAGRNGDQRQTWTFFRTLYEAGVDVVVVAHDHNYQRYFLLDGNFQPDPRNGILLIVTGTGGAPRYEFNSYKLDEYISRGILARDNTDDTTWGITEFTLKSNQYSVRFIPAEGFSANKDKSGTFEDRADGVCHSNSVPSTIDYNILPNPQEIIHQELNRPKPGQLRDGREKKRHPLPF